MVGYDLQATILCWMCMAILGVLSKHKKREDAAKGKNI